MTKKKSKDSQVRQVGRFGLVGIANTVIDLVVQFMLFKLVGLSSTVAAVLSGTVAMAFSFIFNQRFTFKAKHTKPAKIVAFFAFTAFGVWIIRPIIINFLTNSWHWPANTAYDVVIKLHVNNWPGVHTILYSGKQSARGVVANELAILAAIFIVLFYNFVVYKYFVFNDDDKSSK